MNVFLKYRKHIKVPSFLKNLQKYSFFSNKSNTPDEFKEAGQWDNISFLMTSIQEQNKLYKKPLLPLKDSKYNNKLTVVLELDDILLHTFIPDEHEAYINAPLRDHDFYFELKQFDTHISVYKRPFLDEFLKELKENYEAILFTKGIKEYAHKVLELVDPNKSFAHILTNEDCERIIYAPEDMDEYVKDLNRLNRDMARLIYIDSQPISFWSAPDNALPVSSYFGELHDNDIQLKELVEILKYFAQQEDVRTALQEEYQVREILKDSKFL